mmetsp:Transcript_38025/g.98184  ORF Transcript_38025/g.98184 Transcript_38025/m.98184 type:complete len:86 (+) Transcript_38025:316-573(+)
MLDTCRYPDSALVYTITLAYLYMYSIVASVHACTRAGTYHPLSRFRHFSHLPSYLRVFPLFCFLFFVVVFNCVQSTKPSVSGWYV